MVLAYRGTSASVRKPNYPCATSAEIYTQFGPNTNTTVTADERLLLINIESIMYIELPTLELDRTKLPHGCSL